MDFSVMLEQVNGNGHRATELMPTPMIAEAPTRDEAVEKIRTLIGEKLSGAELIRVSVPVSADSNPWLAIAGTWSNRPEVDELSANIKACRRELDADPERA